MQRLGKPDRPRSLSFEEPTPLLALDRVDSEQSAISDSESRKYSDPRDEPEIWPKHQDTRPSRRIESGRYLSVPHADENDETHEAFMSDRERARKPVDMARRRYAYCAWGSMVCMILLALIVVYNMFFQARHQLRAEDDGPEDIFKHWGQPGSGTEGLTSYPTDFLRNIDPIPCHSHNDYWRAVPLFSALHVGCIGVEADVWLHDEELFVGHEPAALQRNRTFQSLYVNPLVKILEHQNPTTEFYNETHRGVFDTDPDQTLVLLVDVKTAGEATWPWVVKQIQPLRERGWLTRYDNGKVIRGAVTVIGTGETPFHLVVENTTYRDAFFDAPLNKLEDSEYDWTNSYYASVSLKQTFGHFGEPSAKQLELLRAQLEEAHNRKLLARYWELPSWPVHLRYHVWEVLTREGMDILNVDDLKGAGTQDWTSGRQNE
jgi:hypothetical protein